MIMNRNSGSEVLAEFIGKYTKYRAARVEFLDNRGCLQSNRDPLAEASEFIVAALLDGKIVNNKVQKDYDIIDSSGKKIQVKYLATPANESINGHTISFPEEADLYAVVYFEDLLPKKATFVLT